MRASSFGRGKRLAANPVKIPAESNNDEVKKDRRRGEEEGEEEGGVEAEVRVRRNGVVLGSKRFVVMLAADNI